MTRPTMAMLSVLCALAIACAGQDSSEPSVVSVPSPPAVPQTVATTLSLSESSDGSTGTSDDDARESTQSSPTQPADGEPDTAAPTPTPTVASSTSTPATAIPTESTGPDASPDGATFTARPSALVSVSVDRDLDTGGGLPIDVWYPTEEGPWPVAVVVHGGGWLSGTKSDMSGFARALAEGGVVVVNAGYSPLDRGGAFPQMFEEVTCAIVAAQQRAADYGGAGPLTVVGFSAGAHVGAVAAFSNGAFDDGCSEVAQPADAFVGIAGPYNSDQFPFLALQFGGLLTEAPDAWAIGNPYTYVGTDADLAVLLLHGENDVVVNPRFSDEFGSALLGAGYEVEEERFPDVGHFSIVRLDENGAPTVASVLDFMWTRALR